MVTEAPVSRYKKTNLKIYITLCIVLTIWFGYDGYFNDKFQQKHTDANGKPDSTLVFNRKAPPFFFGAAILLAGYLMVIKDKKLVADENELILANKEKVSYDSIERIDKTYFDSKGYFIITYKDKSDREVNLKLSDKTYDNLAAILDVIIAKIS